MDLNAAQWVLLAVGALLIGGDKAGLRGLTIVSVPVFAAVFGGRMSTAVVLPLLIVGDLYSVWLYRRHVNVRILLRMLPYVLAGIIAGMLLGDHVDDRTFELIMGGVLLVCLILMILAEWRRRDTPPPDHWGVHLAGGFSGGFATMVGNSATPIMAVYLLSFDLPRDVFIGTGAVFFMAVNLVKVPIHLLVWESMNRETLLISLVLAPLVFIGLSVGYRVVRRIPERPFRYFVIFLTLLGTLRLLLRL